MIGKAKKFAVMPLGKSLSEADINASLKNCFGIDFIVKEISNIAEQEEKQPTVPIQFVCCDGLVYSVGDVNANELRFRGSDVEQIGAVLYVRGE